MKLYSADDPDLQYDLVKVQARIDELLKDGGRTDTTAPAIAIEECQCCCKEHCKVSLHNFYKTKTYIQTIPPMEEQLLELFNKGEVLEEEVEEVEEISDDDKFTAHYGDWTQPGLV